VNLCSVVIIYGVKRDAAEVRHYHILLSSCHDFELVSVTFVGDENLIISDPL
jgi:hypothetical protein